MIPAPRDGAGQDLSGPLWFAALALFGLFASLTLAALLPLQLASPAWVLAASQALVTQAPLALLGLVLARLALVLDPHNRWLLRQCARVSRLALPAAIGFFLLLPLQGYALVAEAQQGARAADGRIDETLTRLERIRAEVQAASGPEDLIRRMEALRVPVRDLSRDPASFPALRSGLLGSLERSQAQLGRQRPRPSLPMPTLPLLQRLLRGMLPALLLGLAFLPLAGPPAEALRDGPDDETLEPGDEDFPVPG
jgi:hypothetical protein